MNINELLDFQRIGTHNFLKSAAATNPFETFLVLRILILITELGPQNASQRLYKVGKSYRCVALAALHTYI